jgi:hypothetical protein
MLSIGVDAHKRLHVAVPLDEAGRIVDRWRGPRHRQVELCQGRMTPRCQPKPRRRIAVTGTP